MQKLGAITNADLASWGKNDLIFPKAQAETAVEHLQQGYLSLIYNRLWNNQNVLLQFPMNLSTNFLAIMLIFLRKLGRTIAL